MTSDDPAVYAVAARSEDAISLMPTYYADKDAAEGKRVEISLHDLPIDGAAEVTYRRLDAGHDGDVVLKQTMSGKDATLYADLDLFTTLLVSVKKI